MPRKVQQGVKSNNRLSSKGCSEAEAQRKSHISGHLFSAYGTRTTYTVSQKIVRHELFVLEGSGSAWRDLPDVGHVREDNLMTVEHV